MELVDKLKAEFPHDDIDWRSQSLTRNGDKALALAYLDARAVMDRLDSVCGIGGWQDSYVETVKGRIICTISILVDGEWVRKSDGAGDTQVEAEKGAISDAFKRAAVKWGIGRYLYDIEAPWVPCESTERGGKRYFKKFTKSPWDCIPKKTVRREPVGADEIIEGLSKATTLAALESSKKRYAADINGLKARSKSDYDRVVSAGTSIKERLEGAISSEASRITNEVHSRTAEQDAAKRTSNYMANDIGATINDSIPF